MKNIILPNFGYVEDRIPNDLYESLLLESNKAEFQNSEMISNLSDDYVAKHFYVNDNKIKLHNYIATVLDNYLLYYPKSADIRLATTDLPFQSNKPWFNYQRQGEYLPSHDHDGIYSYNIWLKIPKKCLFEFTYTNIIGNLTQHKIILTPEDEGKIIFFHAKLPHVAYPFLGSDDVRISVAGNILFKGFNDKRA